MSLRLFVAIEPPLPVREALASLKAHPLWPRQARPVEVENVHLTLLFLGECSEDELPLYKELLDGARHRYASMLLEAISFGAFPNVKRARTLWGGVAGQLEPLLALQGSIEAALSDTPSEHRFVPHLTVGRLKQPEPVIKMANALRGESFGEWMANEVLLMNSDLTPDGPRYEVLHRVWLELSGGETV